MAEHNVPQESPLLRPVETQRASEVIYEQIKDLIISGKFKPGDRLPSERSMMDMVQRSRPTIREALRMLERAGFIRTIPGTNGAIVQELGTEGVEQSLELVLQAGKVSLEELVEYRIHNDTAVARWAALRHTPEDDAAIAAILEEAGRYIAAHNFASFIRLDIEFHSQLAKTARNQIAYILSRVIASQIEFWMQGLVSRQTPEENCAMCRRVLDMHQSVYEEIIHGNANAAEQAMAHHIRVSSIDLKPE